MVLGIPYDLQKVEHTANHPYETSAMYQPKVGRMHADPAIVAEAVERYRMNLALPHVHKTAEGRVLNDYIRRKRPTDPEDMGHLAGELFTFYGTRITQ